MASANQITCLEAVDKEPIHILDLPTEVRKMIWDLVVEQDQKFRFDKLVPAKPPRRLLRFGKKRRRLNAQERKRPPGAGPLLPPPLLATCRTIYEDMICLSFRKGLIADTFHVGLRFDLLDIAQKAPARNLEMVKSIFMMLAYDPFECELFPVLEDLGALGAFPNLRKLTVDTDFILPRQGLDKLLLDLDLEESERDATYRSVFEGVVAALPVFANGITLLVDESVGNSHLFRLPNINVVISGELDTARNWRKLDVKESQHAFDGIVTLMGLDRDRDVQLNLSEHHSVRVIERD